MINYVRNGFSAQTVHDGCDRAASYEQGDFAAGLQFAQVPGQGRMLGAGC